MEAVVLEMQDPKTGVRSQTQRLVITTIPHAITGESGMIYISYCCVSLQIVSCKRASCYIHFSVQYKAADTISYDPQRDSPTCIDFLIAITP